MKSERPTIDVPEAPPGEEGRWAETREIRTSQGPVSLSTPPVDHPPGTLIGRYVVVRPIARGGMGSVMLAYDTALARSVALKVVLTAGSERARERMQREAQAMARLSHPNVVGIYDVGVHAGDVFLAMEYIDGVTLRDWLREPRSRREVLAVMKQAGRGLAAAHQADIIHRDFKPLNVIVAKDGHSFVLDFGLARAVKTDESLPSSARAPPPLLEHSMTQEGLVLGTTGFAAPEVLLGSEIDARADVFSFSVTLWRALYGSMPFPSHGFDEYRRAVCGATPLKAPPSKVPRWLHDVLARGLERSPGARFASMGEMLAALDADPWKRRTAVGGGLVAVAATACVVLGFAHRDATLRAACRAEGDVIATSWTPTSREAARRGMLAETDAFGRERSELTLERLDEYARAWGVEQTGSCDATRLARTQTEAVHERRSECLLEDRVQFEVVSELLASDGHCAHRQSLAMANALPAVRLCAAAAVEKRGLAAPTGAAVDARTLEARREILRAEVLRSSGEFVEAQRLAGDAVTLAREMGDGKLEARAEYIGGRVLIARFEDEEALHHLRQAVVRAESVGADEVGGLAAAKAAFVLLDRLGREDEARGWLELARGKLARLGTDDTLELAIVGTEAFADMEHDPRRALETNAREIALAKRVNGEMHSSYCTNVGNRGRIFMELGDAPSAEASLTQAVECLSRATGPHDAGLGLWNGNLVPVQIALGRWGDAIRSAGRAAEVREALDPKSAALVWIYGYRALALDGAGRYAEAQGEAQRAIDLSRGDPEHVLHTALLAFGVAREGQGDSQGAKAACTRSVELSGKPPDPAKVYPDDAYRCLGEAELALGEVAAAREHLEHSVALPLRISPGELAVSRFALARALVARGPNGRPAPEGERAVALARQARDELRDVVAMYPFRQPWLEDVEHWLAGR